MALWVYVSDGNSRWVFSRFLATTVYAFKTISHQKRMLLIISIWCSWCFPFNRGWYVDIPTCYTSNLPSTRSVFICASASPQPGWSQRHFEMSWDGVITNDDASEIPEPPGSSPVGAVWLVGCCSCQHDHQVSTRGRCRRVRCSSKIDLNG